MLIGDEEDGRGWPRSVRYIRYCGWLKYGNFFYLNYREGKSRMLITDEMLIADEEDGHGWPRSVRYIRYYGWLKANSRYEAKHIKKGIYDPRSQIPFLITNS